MFTWPFHTLAKGRFFGAVAGRSSSATSINSIYGWFSAVSHLSNSGCLKALSNWKSLTGVKKIMFQILLLSSLHNLETYDSAFKFVCGHMPELMAGTDLLSFTKSSLLSLVSDVTLSYVKREDFFDFIVRLRTTCILHQSHIYVYICREWLVDFSKLLFISLSK